MIQTTQDISTQSKPLIAEYADFIGQIKKGSTDQMLRFRIFQIFRICSLRAGNPYIIFREKGKFYTFEGLSNFWFLFSHQVNWLPKESILPKSLKITRKYDLTKHLLIKNAQF